MTALLTLKTVITAAAAAAVGSGLIDQEGRQQLQGEAPPFLQQVGLFFPAAII
jgi:hypothetical protein